MAPVSKPQTGGGNWNGTVTINADANPTTVERALRQLFPNKTITVQRNPNHKGW